LTAGRVTATLVDSNVILDIASEDRDWIEWSGSMLSAAAERGPVVINPVIYAEVSARFDSIESLDRALPQEFYTRAPLPWEAAFLAAKAFQRYRQRGGTRSRTLPDFFIGAHAAVAGLVLLTRDARRYRTYFPTLELIAP
jgi:predicted nucleic acid-binding protein